MSAVEFVEPAGQLNCVRLIRSAGPRSRWARRFWQIARLDCAHGRRPTADATVRTAAGRKSVTGLFPGKSVGHAMGGTEG
jgi:hypothetical protein